MRKSDFFNYVPLLWKGVNEGKFIFINNESIILYHLANKDFICAEVERVNAYRAEHNAAPLT